MRKQDTLWEVTPTDVMIEFHAILIKFICLFEDFNICEF